jgi:hypothetical protein
MNFRIPKRQSRSNGLSMQKAAGPAHGQSKSLPAYLHVPVQSIPVSAPVQMSTAPVVQFTKDDHSGQLGEELSNLDEMADRRRWDYGTGGFDNKEDYVHEVTEHMDSLQASGERAYGQAEAAQRDSAGGHKMYLGRLEDTRVVKAQKGEKHGEAGESRVLNSNPWSMGVNDMFMGGGIDIGARFKMKTPLTPTAKDMIQKAESGQHFLDGLQRHDAANEQKADPNLHNQDAEAGQNGQAYTHTILAQEIAKLIDQNYVFGHAPAANVKKGSSFQAFQSEAHRERHVARKTAARQGNAATALQSLIRGHAARKAAGTSNNGGAGAGPSAQPTAAYDPYEGIIPDSPRVPVGTNPLYRGRPPRG